MSTSSCVSFLVEMSYEVSNGFRCVAVNTSFPGFHFWTFPIYLLTGVQFLFTSAFCNSFVFYKQKMLWTRTLDPFQPSSSALDLSTSASMRVKFYLTHVGANNCATTRFRNGIQLNSEPQDSLDVWLVSGHTHSSFVSGVFESDATRNVWNRPSARETDGSSDSERSDSLAGEKHDSWVNQLVTVVMGATLRFEKCAMDPERRDRSKEIISSEVIHQCDVWCCLYYCYCLNTLAFFYKLVR